MNPLILGILIGLLYAFGGMRVLMLMDDAFDSRVARWAADREWRTWVALILWPLAVAADLAIVLFDRALTRALRKGVRS